MRLSAISLLLSCCALAAVGARANDSCQCDDPVGGGVKCEANQSAGCNPETGKCQCSCTTVKQGVPPEENFAAILTSTLRRRVESAELFLSLPEGRREPRRILVRRDASTFAIPGDERLGISEGPVVIGVPSWLAEGMQQFVRPVAIASPVPD